MGNWTYHTYFLSVAFDIWIVLFTLLKRSRNYNLSTTTRKFLERTCAEWVKMHLEDGWYHSKLIPFYPLEWFCTHVKNTISSLLLMSNLPYHCAARMATNVKTHNAYIISEIVLKIIFDALIHIYIMLYENLYVINCVDSKISLLWYFILSIL